jgi:hypothetical protein
MRSRSILGLGTDTPPFRWETADNRLCRRCTAVRPGCQNADRRPGAVRRHPPQMNTSDYRPLRRRPAIRLGCHNPLPQDSALFFASGCVPSCGDCFRRDGFAIGVVSVNQVFLPRLRRSSKLFPTRVRPALGCSAMYSWTRR